MLGSSAPPSHEQTSPADARPRRRPHAGAIAAALVALVATLALFAPSLVGGKVFAGTDQLLADPLEASVRPPEFTGISNILSYDSVHVFHPDLLVARNLVRAGHLPIWTPFEGTGRPLLASQQSAPLWPLNLLAYVLPFWTSLGWTAALTLLLAFAGVLGFARAFGLRWPGALLAAVAYAYGTYVFTWVAHPHDHVYALLPWALWFVERLVRSGRTGDALGIAAVVGLMLLGGHPQSTVLCLIGVGVVLIARLFWGEREASRGRLLALVVAGAILGLAIGAIMVLPFVEALSQSGQTSRGGLHMPLRALATFAMPELWGRPDRTQLPGAPLNFQEGTLYIGVAPLLLALVAAVTRRDAPVRVMGVLAVVGAGLAFSNPIGNVVGDLPVINAISIVRAVILLIFALAMLGGLGLDRLLDVRAAPRPGPLVGAVAVAVLVVFVCWAASGVGDVAGMPGGLRVLPTLRHGLDPSVISPGAATRWVVLGILAVGLIAAAALGPPRLRRPLAVALVGFSLADLLTIDAGYHPQVDPSLGTPRPMAATSFLQAHLGTQRIVGEQMLAPDTASYYGLNDARAHELPPPQRYSLLWHRLTGVVGLQPQRTDLQAGQAAATTVADIFAARWVLSGAPSPRFRPIPGIPFLQENPDAFPRAWVAYGWRRSASMGASMHDLFTDLQTHGAATHRLMDSPFIEDAPPGPTAAPHAATPATITVDGANKVAVDVNAARPGQLVLDDLYFPGWTATVDGRSADIRPANVAFRAVSIPAGRHEVTFTYRPLSVVAGAIVSVLAALATLLSALLAWRRSRAGRARATTVSAR